MNLEQRTSYCYTSSGFETLTTPIVFVAGWMDGPIKLVQKYAQLYESMGFRVVVLLGTFNDIFFKSPSSVHQDSAALLQKYLDSQTKVVLHLMSNGGAWSWTCFEHHIRDLNLNLVGMVFDSSPSIFDENSKAPKAGLFFPRASPAMVAALDLVGIPFFFAQKLWYGYFPDRHFANINIQRLLVELSAVPKLFLYSQADLLVSHLHVVKAIEIAKSHGTFVQSFDFIDSEHVQHGRKYSEQYQKRIEEFFKHAKI
jgi:hypothetical protein